MFRRQVVMCWAAVLLVLGGSGCWSYDKPNGSDAGSAATGGGGTTGGGGGATGGGGGTTSASLTVRREVTLHSHQPNRVVPSSFSSPPELLVLGGAGWQSVAGGVVDAGVYRFDSIPAGVRYVRFGTNWFVAPADELNLSEHDIGRQAPTTDGGTYLRLATTGLPAWPQFTLEFVAASTGFIGFGAEAALLDPPADGVTPATHTLDYLGLRGGSTLPLVDTTAGDSPVIAVFEAGPVVPTDGGGYTTMSLTRAAQLSPLVVVDHATTDVSATFAPLSPSMTASFDWRRDGFWSHATTVHPAAAARSQSFDGVYLSLLPFTDTQGFYTSTPDLAWLDGYSGGDRGALTVSLSGGNPFPAGWSPLVTASQCIFAAREEVFPDAGTYSPRGCSSLSDLASNVVGRPVGATQSPPQQLRVEGQLPAGPRQFASLTPEVTWLAPAIGAPDGYVVVVRRLVFDSYWYSVQVARFSTTGTSITVPPGVISAGQAYVVEVSAVTGQTFSTPFLRRLPEQYTGAISSVLRAP